MNRIGLSVTLWLIAAFLSFIGSVFCWFLVDREVGLFIGLWVPSILSFGCLVIVARRGRGLEE